MSGANLVNQRNRNEDHTMHDEIEDDSRHSYGFVYNTIYEAGEWCAGTYVGQYATGKIDGLLKLIEDTAKWSLPQGSDKNDSTEPLERPLPWIPFIAMILLLRIVRLSLSIAGLLFGHGHILPKDVVYFIQTRRRKLRAIRITGMREMRRKEEARGQKSAGLVSKLRSLLSAVVCKPGQGMQATTSLGIQNTQEAIASNKTNSTEKYFSTEIMAANVSSSDQDLTLDQIIDRYGNVSSDEDSDFKPPQNMLNRSISSEPTSSASDEDEGDEEMYPTSTNTNLKLESNVNNEYRELETSTISIHDQSLDIKMENVENGEHTGKHLFKPVPPPKPQKPLPIPIHDIKQEPADFDDEDVTLQENYVESGTLSEQGDLEQKSVVASHDINTTTNDVPQDQCLNTDQMDNINGDVHSQIDHTSGSPVPENNFGFQPTSILKNPKAVHLERRGPSVVYHEQNIQKQELTNEDCTPKLEGTIHQHPRGGNPSSGRAYRNKIRGKRR